jgi:hypothetical protein
MIAGPIPNRFGWKYTNNNNPGTSPGTAVTPGATNAEGSWTAIASSANIANDVYGILLWVCGGATTANAKNHLLDIGVDPAGGTSYTERIANIVCGQSAAAVAGGRYFYFPLAIKAGSSVAARIQGSNGTAGTVRVVATFFGKPSKPELVRSGQYAETVGSITNSNGVSFTPGNSNAEGTWVSLGTTAKDLWWWQLCVQIDNGTTTSLGYHIDLAYGDGSNKHMIIENLWLGLAGTAEATASPLPFEGACFVPAGSTIYVRGTCSGTAATGFNAVAVGIGG